MELRGKFLTAVVVITCFSLLYHLSSFLSFDEDKDDFDSSTSNHPQAPTVPRHQIETDHELSPPSTTTTTSPPSTPSTTTISTVLPDHDVDDDHHETPSTTTVPTITKDDEENDQRLGIDSNWYDDQKQTHETSIEDRVTKLPMALALRQFSTATWETVKDGNKDILCNLLITSSKNCNTWKETLAECVLKLGMKNLEKILGDRCTRSGFWKNKLLPLLGNKTSNTGVDESENAWKKLNRGQVWDSSIVKESEQLKQYPYVPPEERVPSIFPPPRICRNGCKHFPIGFGLPRTSYEPSVRRTKNFAWMPLQPKMTPASGPYEAKIEEEDLFHEMYAQSFFGWSHKRGGWDCMRAHDELAAGTIPFFWDLHSCPRNTLGHYPKDLLKKAMELPGVSHMKKKPRRFTIPIQNRINFPRHGEIERSNDPSKPIFDLKRYYELADQIHAYARKYMTTQSIAAYMLKSMEAENAKSAIFFSRGSDDYLEVTVMHGLVDLGLTLTVVSTKKGYDYFYKRVTPDGKMTRQEKDAWLRPQHDYTYGAAFGFSSRHLPHRLQRPWIKNETQIADEVRNGKFDVGLWVLDDPKKRLGLVETAKAAGTKLGFLQFRDLHGDPDSHTMGACQYGGTIFIREMSDKSC